MDARKRFTLKELSKISHAELIGDPDYTVCGVETLEDATPEDVSFLANPRYAEAMKKSSAGAICIDTKTSPSEGKNYLVSDNPSRTFQVVVETLLNTRHATSGFSGIHPTAIIHPTAKIGHNVHIGPYAVIDQDAVIGDQTRLDAHVSIGSGVHIGTSCHLFPHAVVRERCTLGNRVILQPGAVIGSCGFGYTTNASGHHIKLDQLGIVILEDDVEVGANTTIDRARFKATIIKRGTKIDNLVQIGHNVILGEDNIIVSQSGIAGSAKTGRHVILGGQAGVVGHVEITSNVLVATRGGVSKSVTEPGKYAGGPLMPLAEYNRQQVLLRKIGTYVEKIEALEKRVADLEK